MADDLQDRQSLLAEIQRERANVDALFAPLDEPGMMSVAREDGWSAKDILAHLTAWEQRLLAWVDRWRATGNPGRPEVGVSWEGEDALNERDYLSAKEKAAADVRSEAAASYEAVMSAIEALTDNELALQPEAADGPSWAWIIGANTYEHYREHREEMELYATRRT
ncbi:MAG: ClbS/DfsB family four-helix bundle protein [Chloroflexi bacterium]|nr:ClbS/DfsB family four-helix bundle protein [Chloroflexota bacterium]MCH8066552.1 ClbS/DfsB family four-helix bundle protein [Chloroflexota bacterium]